MSNKYPALFNFFGLDPFDFGATNLANGFCNMNKEISNMAKAFRCAANTPNVHRVRDEKQEVFYVELPGCKKEDIKVTVEDENTIGLKATRKIGGKESKFDTTLYSDMDIENAKLAYADGLLTIVVEPKKVVEPERKVLEVK